MKQPQSLDYDELERWRDWAEAEYCQRCGGRGEIPIYWGLSNQTGPDEWKTCPRCKGTGRA